MNLPDTASPTTRALADALCERGELMLGSDASYAERKALLESTDTLTPAFAETRAEALRKRVRRDAAVLGLALVAIVLNGVNLFGSGSGVLGWLMAALVVAGGAFQAYRWHRKHEAALLHDVLAVALEEDVARAEPTGTRILAPSSERSAPSIRLDAHPEKSITPPFTRARRGTPS